MSTAGTVTRWSISVGAVLLFLIGIVHAVVNVRSLEHRMAAGVISEHFGKQMVANVAFGGAMISLLGVFAAIVAYGRASARRSLWWIGLLVGLFFVAFGVAGYLLEPIPSVFLFSALGTLICVPLLVWREDFLGD
jgi:hypothetical protein